MHSALLVDIPEREFWEMSLLEIKRAVEAKVEIRKYQAQCDYNLAALITQGFAQAMGGKTKFPSFEKAYPQFANPTANDKTAQSVINFKKFANQHNAKFYNREAKQ